jgi:hypothetical protein
MNRIESSTTSEQFTVGNKETLVEYRDINEAYLYTLSSTNEKHLCAMELATITTHSETGFSDPGYTDVLPDSLAQAGMSKESWQSFIQRANNSVKFDWNIGTICCFLSNAHNKSVARNMTMFCEDVASLLPDGVAVTYKMTTEKQIVHGHNGPGATLQTYHKLIFNKKD